MQRHALPARQLDHGVDRRYVRLDQVLDGRVDQRETGIEMHAVQVLERALDGVGPVLLERVQASLPPQVGLDRDQQVRVRLPDDAQQSVGIAVGHQDVDVHDAQHARAVAPRHRLRLARMKTGVGLDPVRLVGEAGDREGGRPPRQGPGRVRRPRVPGDQHQRERCVLQARKVVSPHEPVSYPQERQEGNKRQQYRQGGGQPICHQALSVL